MVRQCYICKRFLQQYAFSVAEWSAGEGNSRCAPCAQLYSSPFLPAPSAPLRKTAGSNNASGASRKAASSNNASGAPREAASSNNTSSSSSSSSASSASSASNEAAGPSHASGAAHEGTGYDHAGGGSVSYRELSNPFASGKRRWLAKGKYTSGAHEGEACVVKWFKSTDTALEKDYFAADTTAVDRAIDIVDEFNKLEIADKEIKVRAPAAWKFNQSAGDWGSRWALCEPFIKDYEKYNSNTGWKNNYWGDGTNPWPSIMQALSHFSYHLTERENVLCDLQGGVDEEQVILSNPVVLSLGREYGVTDLGTKGIYNFFHHHTCNTYCRSNWIRPNTTQEYFAPVPYTTMASL